MRDERNKRFGKALLALTLAFVLLLTSVAGAVEVFAEEGLKTIDFAKGIVVEKPEPKAPITEDAKAKDEKASPVIEKDAKEEKAELELGDEIVGEPVGAAVKAPTVNPILYDATTISGADLAKAKVKVGNKTQNVIATVHVTLKGEDGTTKATLEVTPTSGTTWEVNLPQGKKVEKGDTVTVYQQIGEDKSPEVTKTAQPSKASTVTLAMPTGEIWIEQTSSNIVNKDEQAEAVQMFNNANTAIAGDIKSVKFSIDGTEHAYYEVTYTDGSTSGQVEATNLQIKQVTETSRGAKLNDITIVDNVIKGKLTGEGPFDKIKVQLVVRVNKDKAGQYCNENKCTVDKDSSTPVEVALESDGTFSYTLQAFDSLTLGQIVGVSVKEPHKFVSCSTTTVKPVTVEKTEVKDPRKLTDDNKAKIIEAIKKAYTVDGVSKLPDGTGDWKGVPAVIQIDDSGNVKIFSGNDVKGDWDWNNGGIFVPEKNEDGSVKLNDGAEPKITIPAKDLVKNIKPDAPTVALSKDKKNITITPNEKDTDAHIITVTYKDKDGKDQTTTATKADDGTWSITEGKGSVDQNGVITLPKNKVKGGTDVTATVTDKGGIADDDTTPLTSDSGSLPIKETKADKVEALGGLDPVELKKWVGDTVDWKKGVKAKDSTKETEINKLLVGATFTDETETKRTTDNSGDFEGKVKVKFSDDSEIIVEKQMLYVSDLVSPSDKENLPEDAIDVELKLGEGVKAGEVEGNKETPVTAKTYKVKPGTDLSKEKVSKTKNTCFEDVGATVSDDTYVDVAWKDSKDGKDFKATAKNNIFTATATKKFKVTVQPNGGTGEEKVEFKKKDETFKLPAKDTFTPPNENQEFSGWQVGEDTTLKQPGAKITITGDTTVKAIWKPIELKVSFNAGTGASGEMKDVPVNKGSEYELPTPTFTPPTNKEFAGWQVPGETEVKKAKDKITITDNITLTATWKPIMVNVTFDGNGGEGSMDAKTVEKGSTYKLPDNKFTAPENQEFKAWEVDGKEVAAGTEITVDKDTKVKAIWKDIMVNVSYDANGGSGEMKGATQKKGSKYTLSENSFKAPNENQEFKAWEVNGKEVAAGTEITLDKDTEIKAIWKDIMVNVSYDANGGNGKMEGKELKKGSTLTLPTNGFTAPKNQEFKAWQVDGKEVAAGTEITLDKDTEVKAIWKPIMVDVSFDKGEGSGSKDKVSVAKGSEYQLPDSKGFTAPAGKEFAGWQVGKETKKVGDKITVNENTVVKALWKTKAQPGKDTGNKEERPIFFYIKPTTKPVLNLKDHSQYMIGYKDGTFRPNNKMSRQEVTVMLSRLLSERPQKGMIYSRDYKDVADNLWSVAAISYMSNLKMVKGYPDGNFRPYANITRAEFAAMVVRFENISAAGSKTFTDLQKDHWAYEVIQKAAQAGWISGYPDGSFRPDQPITRAEVVAITNRMLNRFADEDFVDHNLNKITNYTDIDKSHWAYYPVVEATNGHNYDRKANGKDETWFEVTGSTFVYDK